MNRLIKNDGHHYYGYSLIKKDKKREFKSFPYFKPKEKFVTSQQKKREQGADFLILPFCLAQDFIGKNPGFLYFLWVRGRE